VLDDEQIHGLRPKITRLRARSPHPKSDSEWIRDTRFRRTGSPVGHTLATWRSASPQSDRRGQVYVADLHKRFTGHPGGEDRSAQHRGVPDLPSDLGKHRRLCGQRAILGAQ